MTYAGAARSVRVQEQFLVPALDRIRGQSAADRYAGRGAVGKMETPVVFRTFNRAVEDQSVGQVRVAVGADAVSGKDLAVAIADQHKGFFPVVKADHVQLAQISIGTDFHPAFGIRRGGRAVGRFERPIAWRRQPALDVVRRILHLAAERRENFAPRGQDGRIGRRTIISDDRVQLGQRMVRHEREHVMFHVVVHVPVDKPADRIHVNRPAVEPVVEDVLGQSGVLRRIVDDHEPRPKELGQHKQEDRKPAMPNDRGGDHHSVNSKTEPRIAINLREFAFRDEGALGVRDDSQRVPDHAREVGPVAAHVEKIQDERAKIGRTRNLDFGIAPDDDSVAMMPGVAPAPDHGFPHYHERREFIKHVGSSSRS